MTPNEQARQVLRDAADLIEERGWMKGAAIGPNGEVCAIEAICSAARTSEDVSFGMWHRLALAAFRSFKQRHGLYPSIYNDQPDRTKAEVVNALREAGRE